MISEKESKKLMPLVENNSNKFYDMWGGSDDHSTERNVTGQQYQSQAEDSADDAENRIGWNENEFERDRVE